MKRTGWIVVGLCLALLPLILFAPSGCEVGSADSVVRTLGIDFTGFYQGYGTNGTQLVVPPNSGDAVTLLNLRQNGDQLEVIDNNGIVFRGVLGNLVEQTASFTLEGSTTVGNPVTISGTLTGVGTAGTMHGTWIEPDLYATLSAQGVINPAPTNVTPTNITTKVATPVITGSPGTTFSNTVTVTITCATTGATIRYTAGPTIPGDPTESSDEYAGPLSFTTTTTVKAKGFKVDLSPSDVATVTFLKQ
jgi:hypothetical protein